MDKKKSVHIENSGFPSWGGEGPGSWWSNLDAPLLPLSKQEDTGGARTSSQSLCRSAGAPCHVPLELCKAPVGKWGRIFGCQQWYLYSLNAAVLSRGCTLGNLGGSLRLQWWPLSQNGGPSAFVTLLDCGPHFEDNWHRKQNPRPQNVRSPVCHL